MAEFNINLLSYFGCVLIGFLIGFLELLRVRILGWLPMAVFPLNFSGGNQSHAHFNSFVLSILLLGLIVFSGFGNLFSSSPTGPIHWHWTKIGLIIVSVAAGEYSRLKLYEYMSNTAPPAPRTLMTATDFNDSVDARQKADFLESDYANHFSSYEDYVASLQP